MEKQRYAVRYGALSGCGGAGLAQTDGPLEAAGRSRTGAFER